LGWFVPQVNKPRVTLMSLNSENLLRSMARPQLWKNGPPG